MAATTVARMSDFQAPQSQSYPAGWHPTPDGMNERYWDGTAWTDAYRPRNVAAQAPVGYQAQFPQPQVVGYGVQMAPVHGPAVASMVLGIVSLVLWWLGIITGIIGLALGATSLKHCLPRGAKRGRGMAIAGIVCSIIALAFWGLILIAAAIASNS
jgi:hypothetical protein